MVTITRKTHPTIFNGFDLIIDDNVPPHYHLRETVRKKLEKGIQINDIDLKIIDKVEAFLLTLTTEDFETLMIGDATELSRELRTTKEYKNADSIFGYFFEHHLQ